jgi:hypothetical protein
VVMDSELALRAPRNDERIVWPCSVYKPFRRNAAASQFAGSQPSPVQVID